MTCKDVVKEKGLDKITVEDLVQVQYLFENVEVLKLNIILMLSIIFRFYYHFNEK